MTTRGQAALLCFGLCYVSSFSFAAPSDLPIDTALSSLNHPIITQVPTEATPFPHRNDLPVQTPATAQVDTQVLWPMMPQESLAQLAQTFYPNSPILAQRFIQKSIRLSRSLGIHITPDMPFQHAQVIAIPDEKEVRALTHRIKKREELLSEQEQLQLSYQLKMTSPPKSQDANTPKPEAESSSHQRSVGINLPELKVPTIAFPPLQAPNFEHMVDRLTTASHHVWARVQNAWQTSMSRLADWQVYTFGQSIQLHQTNLANIWANQTTRIALLLGGVGLLVWVVRRMQQRYLQRKIALLNNIESTLIEPDFIEPTISELSFAEGHEAKNERESMSHSMQLKASGMHESESNPSPFQDTESLLEQLSVDAQRNEDGISEDTTIRPERLR